MEKYRGTLRLVRVGDHVKAFYRSEGDQDWVTLGRLPFKSREVKIAFGLSNYGKPSTGILASRSISASFDNFRINAAQEIIESEI